MPGVGGPAAVPARRKLEDDYRSSVVYFLGGLVVLAGSEVLNLSGYFRGSLAGLPTTVFAMGMFISVLGASLIGINGWLLKRQSPHSALPSIR
jgi:hypothetical protein